MNTKFIILSVIHFLVPVTLVFGQHLPDIDKTYYDSAYVSVDDQRWSIRIYPDYKFHGFKLRSNDPKAKINYRPNNYFGFGLGFNYKKFKADYSIQFQLNGTFVETKRTDFQMAFQLNQRYVVGLGFQFYKGMIDQSNGFKWINVYRSDVRSRRVNAYFLRNFSSKKFVLYDGFSTGLEQKKRTSVFLGGIYGSWISLSGDSSIVNNPGADDFNTYAQITNSNLGVIGATGGAAYVHPLKHRMFVMALAIPGLGFTTGRVYTESLSYSPALFPNFRIMTKGAIGIIQPWYYVSLVLDYEYMQIPLGHSNNLNYNYSGIKLIIGFRFKNDPKLPNFSKWPKFHKEE